MPPGGKPPKAGLGRWETLVMQDGVQYIRFQAMDPKHTYTQVDKVPDFDQNAQSYLSAATMSSETQVGLPRNIIEPRDYTFVVRVFSLEGEYYKQCFYPNRKGASLINAAKFNPGDQRQVSKYDAWLRKVVEEYQDVVVGPRRWVSEEINLARKYVNSVIATEGLPALAERVLGSEEDAKLFNRQRQELGKKKAGLNRTIGAIKALFDSDPMIRDAVQEGKDLQARIDAGENISELELKPKEFISVWDCKHLKWSEVHESEDFPWENELDGEDTEDSKDSEDFKTDSMMKD